MRVFYAIEPDPDSRRRLEALLQDARQPLSRCGRLTSLDNLHLTLLFVGEWPSGKISLLESTLDEAVRGFGPFVIRFDRFGTFDHGRKDDRGRPGPLILWLGDSTLKPGKPPADSDHRMLISLVEQLRQTARLLGIPTESRPFTPHLTLTRQMPAEQAPEILASLPDFEPILFKTGAVTLMQSIPDNGRMRYEPVKRVSLTG